MSVMLSQIASVVVLAPALQFGQLPNIKDVSGATKEAFQATANALDTAAANGKANGKKGKPTVPKRGSSPAKSSASQSESTGTMFSKLGERANNPNPANVTNARAAAEEQEKNALRFLGSASNRLFRGMLAVVGLGLAWCIVSRIRSKVTDLTTGRPSLAKSKIVRRC